MNLQIYGSHKEGFHGSGDSTDELLEPCPFCGSLEVVVMNTHTPSYWAECQTCGAKGPDTTYPRREAKSKSGVRRQHRKVFRQAISLWNKRAEL